MAYEISAGGVVISNSKVIVVFQKRTQTWSLPKGHLNHNETLEETARREIFEETGVKDLIFIKELGSYIRSTKDAKLRKKITLFQFTTKQTKLQSHDSDNPEVKWIDIDEVPKILSYEEDKNFFLKIKNLLNLL